MIVEDRNKNTENYYSLDCFCLKRIFCSPNRVEPSTSELRITEGSINQEYSDYSSFQSPTEDAEMQQQNRRFRRKTPVQVHPESSLQPESTPEGQEPSPSGGGGGEGVEELPYLPAPQSRAASVQQSRSSHALVSPVENNKAYRPTTRVMNRNPSADEIARLPHVLSPTKTQSDVNLSSKGNNQKNSGFRLGGKVLLPPLPVLRKGAEGDQAKQVTSKAKSLFRRKTDLDKRGDDGSGEQVVTFSLPPISSLDSGELRDQNQVVRKGGLAYDIILPSTKPSLPHIQRARFDRGPRRNLGLPETKLEPEKNLEQKLEKAEKRRLARQEEIRRQSRLRAELIEQSKVDQRDQANDRKRHLDAKLRKAAEKRKEQLDSRQAASRRRLERVRRLRRTSEGSFDQIETEDMTQEDIWNFLVSGGNELGEKEKDVAWWEKNRDNKRDEEGDRSNSKIPRYKHN